MRIIRIGFTLVLSAVLAAASAAAQDTRAAAIAARKAEKAKQLRPYVPTRAELLVTRAGNALGGLARGFYPAFGSVYSGGGFAAGPAFREYFGDTYIDARTLYSIRQYKLAEVGMVAPSILGGRATLRLDAGWRDATEVGYYGLGMDTTRADRADYRMKQAFGGAGIELRPARVVTFGAAAGVEDYSVGPGLSGRPDVDSAFTPVTAPGLNADPTYVRLGASAALDSRPSPGYARRGSLLRAGYDGYIDRDETFSFGLVTAEAVQHLPILRETWVLSVRGRVQSVASDDDTVPYYLLPALGSGSTLRAYSSRRFRDRHALLLQAEWRWIVNRSGLDMAVFYDAGKVTSRRSQLDLDNLESDFGIGIRFHGPRTTPLRLDVAHGSEGLRLVFGTSAVF